MKYYDLNNNEETIDFFAERGSNVVLFGPMGSGASIWISDFMVKHYMEGAKVRLLSYGGGYKKITSLMDGINAYLTDGINTKDIINTFNKDFYTFHTEEPASKVIEFLEDVLKEAKSDYSQDKNSKMVVVLTEAWKYLDSNDFVDYYNSFSKKLLKYNGTLLLATQCIKDCSKIETTLLDTNTTKILLSHSVLFNNALSPYEKRVNSLFNAKQKNTFKEMNHYCFFIEKDGEIFGRKYMLDNYDYLLYTESPKDVSVIENAMKSLKCNDMHKAIKKIVNDGLMQKYFPNFSTSTSKGK